MQNIQEDVVGVIVDETTTFSIREVCAKCNISQGLLVQMVEHGLFEFNSLPKDDEQIDLKTLKRIESAFHLYHDLEINMPGISLILELKDELEQLRKQLSLLSKHVDDV